MHKTNIDTIQSVQCFNATGYRHSCRNKNTCFYWHIGEVVGQPVSLYTAALGSEKDEKIEGQSRYEKRERKKSAKAILAERQDEENKKERPPRYCKACNKSMHRKEAICAGCDHDIHDECIKLIIKKNEEYCPSCAGALSWQDVETYIDIPITAMAGNRTAAQIEEKRCQAVLLRKTKAKEKEELMEQNLQAQLRILEEEVNQRNEELLRHVRGFTIL